MSDFTMICKSSNYGPAYIAGKKTLCQYIVDKPL